LAIAILAIIFGLVIWQVIAAVLIALVVAVTSV
jgi:hypothetical protein